MRALLLLSFSLIGTLSSLSTCSGKWIEVRVGSLEVISDGREAQARVALNDLEQLRTAVSVLLGAQDLQPTWPLRFVLSDGKAEVAHPSFELARDAWTASGSTVLPETRRSASQRFLESWGGNIPPKLERGLLTLISTLEVAGTRVTLGAPPKDKDRDWSRAHMLTVDPNYSGKVRVLLGNLGKGVDREVAFRNAFQKTEEQIEQDLDRYIEAGNYGTIPISGRAISARQFAVKTIADNQGATAGADVLLAHGDMKAKAAYEAVLAKSPAYPQAVEGLGLLLHNPAQLEVAQSARGLLERAGSANDLAQKKALLEAAVKANPRWSEPHKQLASIESHPAQKLAALRSAAQLDPRDSNTWIALARAQEAAGQMAEATKSWTSADRATDDPNQRNLIRQSRGTSEARRAEQQINERLEARRKAEQEINDLRNRALMDIRKAEAAANAGREVLDASKLDRYDDGKQLAEADGVLQRITCVGSSKIILHIAKGKTVRKFTVADTTRLILESGGQLSANCGAQKPAREVVVKYLPSSSLDAQITGEASSLRFR